MLKLLRVIIIFFVMFWTVEEIGYGYECTIYATAPGTFTSSMQINKDDGGWNTLKKDEHITFSKTLGIIKNEKYWYRFNSDSMTFLWNERGDWYRALVLPKKSTKISTFKRCDDDQGANILLCTYDNGKTYFNDNQPGKEGPRRARHEKIKDSKKSSITQNSVL
jgi:hypothetical protein